MFSQPKNDPKPVIDLKLWIFKFIHIDDNDDRWAVCVEGYRTKDVEERELMNWRSTAVRKRVNSQTLLTVSGSTYTLRGVIDQHSAYAIGYPKILTERFKDGFPYDWQELLHDYYTNVVKYNKLNTSQRLFSPLLSDIFLDISRRSRGDGGHRSAVFGSILAELQNTADKTLSSMRGSNVKREKHLLITEKIVEEEDEEETSKDKQQLSTSKSSRKDGNSTSRFSTTSFGTPLAASSRDNSKHQKVTPKRADSVNDRTSSSNGRRKSVESERKFSGTKQPEDLSLFKMPLLPIQRRTPKCVQLYNWTIRFSANDLGHSKLFPNFAFVIVGFRPDKNLDWKTSCIVAVESGRVLRTETGYYELIGPINTMLAAQQGFPKEFVAQFLDGFPNDWHRILSLFFNTYIEPQLPQQQSLTISEIHDDDFTGSIRSSSSESDSDEEVEDSFLDENVQYNRKEQHNSFLKRHNSRKSVQYRIDEPYRAEKKTARRPKSEWNRSPAVKKKRVKLERIGEVIQTPDLSLLKTTRSGRTVKPRLATWKGQRIMYDVRGSPIKAIGITTDSIYSTSISDSSSWLTARERTLREMNGNRIRKARLVAYSDSGSTSSSNDDDDEDDNNDYVNEQKVEKNVTKHSPLTPVTPFYGKRGAHISHVIRSASEEEDEDGKGTERAPKKRHHKLRKRQAKNNNKKNIRKQKRKPKKGTPLKAKKVEAKENKSANNAVTETEPIISFSDVESENDAAVGNANGVSEGKNSKAKKWTENDNTRLKLAVQAMHPENDQDWENIATTMRLRTADECRKQALEILNLKITPKEVVKKIEVPHEIMDALKKTKVGTLAYQIQADRFTRQYLKAGDGSDFFEETMDAGPSTRKVAMMPSVTTFDSDDSLLSVLRTPTPRPARRNNRRKKLLCVPESPSSDSSARRSKKKSEVMFNFKPDDEAYRAQQLRYVHRMMKARNQYNNNTSRVNSTKSSVPTNYRLKMPPPPSSSRSKHRKHDNSDVGSDEDEYFEEEEDD